MPPVIFHRSNDCGIFDLKHILIGLIALCAMDRHTEPTALDELMLIGRVCLRNRWLKCVMVWQSSSPPRSDGSFAFIAPGYAGASGTVVVSQQVCKYQFVLCKVSTFHLVGLLKTALFLLAPPTGGAPIEGCVTGA